MRTRRTYTANALHSSSLCTSSDVANHNQQSTDELVHYLSLPAERELPRTKDVVRQVSCWWLQCDRLPLQSVWGPGTWNIRGGWVQGYVIRKDTVLCKDS